MSASDLVAAAVWSKAQYVNEKCEDQGFRKDQCGAWIKLDDYGNRNSAYGWEIHHVVPVSQGGSDAVENLVPLHWQNNASTGDGALTCTVTSSGNTNVTS